MPTLVRNDWLHIIQISVLAVGGTWAVAEIKEGNAVIAAKLESVEKTLEVARADLKEHEAIPAHANQLAMTERIMTIIENLEEDVADLKGRLR